MAPDVDPAQKCGIPRHVATLSASELDWNDSMTQSLHHGFWPRSTIALLPRRDHCNAGNREQDSRCMPESHPFSEHRHAKCDCDERIEVAEYRGDRERTALKRGRQSNVGDAQRDTAGDGYPRGAT